MSTHSHSVTPTHAAIASAASSSAASGTISAPPNLKIVGILLAVASGLLIGSSFVFKKRGLLRSQAGGEAGEGVAYLKSPLWWTGMIMMIMGEICNFAAYAFVEAIVVTPLGALSVVICAILSSLFLNEKLSFFGWLGCTLCILGSIIIALNGPQEQSIGQITEFQKLFLAPGFLAFMGVLISASLTIIFYFAPKYGKKSMLWYISVCSMIGGLSVSVTTGLGAAIVQTALGDNQFKHWFLYFLLGFVVITLLTEVYYLNVALALFNTAMVTPTYYVIFTFFSMVTTIVLFDGLKASASQILTLVLAFLVICVGITILQMSKIDPTHLKKLDRRSTMLLQAARSQTQNLEEKGLQGIEDPGIDALRGSFGTVGSIIRARSARRMSQSSRGGATIRSRMPSGLPYEVGAGMRHPYGAYDPHSSGLPMSSTGDVSEDPYVGMQRHQLYDAPMPPSLNADDSASLSPSMNSAAMAKKPTIKFGETDTVHQYNRPGQGETNATHEQRQAIGSPVLRATEYPPMPGQSPALLPPPLPSPHEKEKKGTNVKVNVDLVALDDEPALPTGMSNVMGPASAKGSGGGTANDRQQSSFMIPPLDPAIRSAPPTLNQKFNTPPIQGGAVPRPAGPARMDSRNIFGSHESGGSAGSAGGRGTPPTPKTAPGRNSDNTLLSFMSVTEAGNSERSEGRPGSNGSSSGGNSTRAVVGVSNVPASGWDDDLQPPQALNEKSGSVRGRSARRYPKGDGDDDREESESLWQRGQGERRGTGGLTSEEESGDDPSLDSLPGGGIRLVQPGGSGTGRF